MVMVIYTKSLFLIMLPDQSVSGKQHRVRYTTRKAIVFVDTEILKRPEIGNPSAIDTSLRFSFLLREKDEMYECIPTIHCDDYSKQSSVSSVNKRGIVVLQIDNIYILLKY